MEVTTGHSSATTTSAPIQPEMQSASSGSTNLDLLGTVRVFRQDLHSMMPLVPAPAHLQLLHACDQCHSSRMFTPRIGWHRKLRPNTEGSGVEIEVWWPVSQQWTHGVRLELFGFFCVLVSDRHDNVYGCVTEQISRVGRISSWNSDIPNPQKLPLQLL
jgi:hypothetical protein